jgi:hypothetical protein
MFRKFLIATVASLSFLSPLAIPAESQARDVHRVYRGHEVRRVYPAHYGFQVYIRGCNREAWRVGGDFRFREDAVRAARNFRARGFEAYIG